MPANAGRRLPHLVQHRLFLASGRHRRRIDGIAIRDREDDLADFLARNGDPYERIGNDMQSEVQISLGSSGVPESFVVDGKGVIRYQHIGPIEASDVSTILAKLEQAP